MSDSVTKPCMVEAAEGGVVLECETAATSFIPNVARHVGRPLIEEANKAEAQAKSVGPDAEVE